MQFLQFQQHWLSASTEGCKNESLEKNHLSTTSTSQACVSSQDINRNGLKTQQYSVNRVIFRKYFDVIDFVIPGILNDTPEMYFIFSWYLQLNSVNIHYQVDWTTKLAFISRNIQHFGWTSNKPMRLCDSFAFNSCWWLSSVMHA